MYKCTDSQNMGQPVSNGNNKYRLIDTAQLSFHTSKLLSSGKVCICGFINWGLGRIILPPATSLFLKKGVQLFVTSLGQIFECINYHGII